MCTYCEFREEWYLRCSDGTKIFVAEYGVGEPIIGLHGGWGGEHSYLIDAFRGLERHYRMVLYDQRGSLRSICPSGEITLGKHIEDLEHLRVELGLERLNLVGHSMGSFLAMAYLNKYPEHVKKLVLVSPLLPRSPQEEVELKLYQELEQKKQAFRKRPEIQAELKKAGLDRPNLTDKERTWRWRIIFAADKIYDVSKWRYFRGGQAFYSEEAARKSKESCPEEYDFTEALKNHPYPIYLITSDYDFGVGSELHKLMLKNHSNVHFVEIKNAGHNIWIDQPEAFRDALIYCVGF